MGLIVFIHKFGIHSYVVSIKTELPLSWSARLFLVRYGASHVTRVLREKIDGAVKGGCGAEEMGHVTDKLWGSAV
jgi:hypothetical protein